MPGPGSLPSAYEYKPLPMEQGLRIRESLQKKYEDTQSSIQKEKKTLLDELPKSVLNQEETDKMAQGVTDKMNSIASSLEYADQVPDAVQQIRDLQDSVYNDPFIAYAKALTSTEPERISWMTKNTEGLSLYDKTPLRELYEQGITVDQVLSDRAENVDIYTESQAIFTKIPGFKNYLFNNGLKIEEATTWIGDIDQAFQRDGGTEGKHVRAHKAFMEGLRQLGESGSTSGSKMEMLKARSENYTEADLPYIQAAQERAIAEGREPKDITPGDIYVERVLSQEAIWARDVTNVTTGPKDNDAENKKSNPEAEGVSVSSTAGAISISDVKSTRDLERVVEDKAKTVKDRNEAARRLEKVDFLAQSVIDNVFTNGEFSEELEKDPEALREAIRIAISKDPTQSNMELTPLTGGPLSVTGGSLKGSSTKEKEALVAKVRESLVSLNPILLEKLEAKAQNYIETSTEHKVIPTEKVEDYYKKLETTLSQELLTGALIQKEDGTAKRVSLYGQDYAQISSLISEMTPEGKNYTIRETANGTEIVLTMANEVLGGLTLQDPKDTNLKEIVDNAKKNIAGETELTFDLTEGSGTFRYLPKDLQDKVVQAAAGYSFQKDIDGKTPLREENAMSEKLKGNLTKLNNRNGLNLVPNPQFESGPIAFDIEEYEVKTFEGILDSKSGVTFNYETGNGRGNVTVKEATERMYDKANIAILSNIVDNVSSKMTDEELRKAEVYLKNYNTGTEASKKGLLQAAKDGLKDIVKKYASDDQAFKFTESYSLTLYGSNYFEQGTSEVNVEGRKVELEGIDMYPVIEALNVDQDNTIFEEAKGAGDALKQTLQEKALTEFTLDELSTGMFSRPGFDGPKGLPRITTRELAMLKTDAYKDVRETVGLDQDWSKLKFDQETQYKLMMAMLKTKGGLDTYIKDADRISFADRIKSIWADLSDEEANNLVDSIKV